MGTRAGFTLTELLITMTVLGILAGLAFPPIMEFVQINRLTGQVNQFTGLLYYARSEAVRRGTRVTVCRSSDLSSCSTSTNWENGRIVFVDGSTAGTKDGTDEVLRKQEYLTGSNTLRGSDAFTNYVSFLSTGYASGTGSSSGSFRLCDSRGSSEAYTIFVNAAGRIRTASTATSCP